MATPLRLIGEEEGIVVAEYISRPHIRMCGAGEDCECEVINRPWRGLGEATNLAAGLLLFGVCHVYSTKNDM